MGNDGNIEVLQGNKYGYGAYGIVASADGDAAITNSGSIDVYSAGIANGAAAIMLFRFRSGDANMRSVWICSRNDAIGNIAVVLAAGGVFGLNSAWPDLVVATLMAVLGLSGGFQIMRQARAELRSSPSPVPILSRGSLHGSR